MNFFDKLKKYEIYLASQSPRRQLLLKQMGIEFNIATKVEFNETFPKTLIAEEIPMYLAEKKSEAYSFVLKENRILITADTIVYKENKVFNKPKNRQEAIKMLKELSSSKHLVITGITLRDTKKIHTFFCTTEVWFSKIDYNEIEYYIDNYHPYDKAGSYGIQEWIGLNFIEKINGSYFNVVGLPTEKLYVEIKKFIN